MAPQVLTRCPTCGSVHVHVGPPKPDSHAACATCGEIRAFTGVGGAHRPLTLEEHMHFQRQFPRSYAVLQRARKKWLRRS